MSEYFNYKSVDQKDPCSLQSEWQSFKIFLRQKTPGQDNSFNPKRHHRMHNLLSLSVYVNMCFLSVCVYVVIKTVKSAYNERMFLKSPQIQQKCVLMVAELLRKKPRPRRQDYWDGKLSNVLGWDLNRHRPQAFGLHGLYSLKENGTFARNNGIPVSNILPHTYTHALYENRLTSAQCSTKQSVAMKWVKDLFFYYIYTYTFVY